MQCHNCGHDNPLTNSFCAKCASHLSANLKLVRSRQAFVPPQEELANQVHQRVSSTASKPSSWLAVWLAVGFILLLSILYGFFFP